MAPGGGVVDSLREEAVVTGLSPVLPSGVAVSSSELNTFKMQMDTKLDAILVQLQQLANAHHHQHERPSQQGGGAARSSTTPPSYRQDSSSRCSSADRVPPMRQFSQGSPVANHELSEGRDASPLPTLLKSSLITEGAGAEGVRSTRHPLRRSQTQSLARGRSKSMTRNDGDAAAEAGEGRRCSCEGATISAAQQCTEGAGALADEESSKSPARQKRRSRTDSFCQSMSTRISSLVANPY